MEMNNTNMSQIYLRHDAYDMNFCLIDRYDYIV